MRRIAIIPARGGSKRIPKKNIKPFLGKPIIAYSIEVALNSGLFDEVMVSTDDEEIMKIAKELGAFVPFVRSESNANDTATLAEVIEEVILLYKEQGNSFDQYCCILATAPFINENRLKESFDLLNEKGYKTVFPVLNFSYPTQRALQIDNENKVSMVNPENLTVRSQDLTPTYHDAGQYYCGNVADFENDKALFTDNSGCIQLGELEVQDIDTPSDWEMAEIKYKILKNKTHE